jgi:tetratricopeptide (TPR) repeat protein
MAPEQANGEWERADERLDVFGLGGVLCALLTGEPPYRGSSEGEVLRKAQRGDLAEAFARLSGCGADAALVALAKECLCAERDDRPRDAGVVAGRVTAYLAAVQDQLRAAEVERAAAQARAEEAVKKATAERRARRLQGLTAGAVLLLVLAGSVILWMIRARREEDRGADQAAESELKGAEVLLAQGWETLNLEKLQLAKNGSEKAREGAKSARVKEKADRQARDAKQKLTDATEHRARFDDFLGAIFHLGDESGWAKGEPTLRALIRDHSQSPELYFYLGWSLYRQHKVGASVQEYRKAIELSKQHKKPPFPAAWNYCGVSLELVGELGEAEAAYSEAAELRRDYRWPWDNLGKVRLSQKKLSAAERAYLDAITSNRQDAGLHRGLARVFMQQGRFKKALEELETASKLGDTSTKWRETQDQLQRFEKLEPRLVAIRKGGRLVSPVPIPRDLLDIARLCAIKKLHADSARFFRDAFAADPEIATRANEDARYEAACNAALAGCRKGKDAPRTDEACFRLRGQAFDWLCADLSEMTKTLNNPKGVERLGRDPMDDPVLRIAWQMGRWRSDPDLAGVRDAGLLAKLPEEERRRWEKLWRKVINLQQKASASR